MTRSERLDRWLEERLAGSPKQLFVAPFQPSCNRTPWVAPSLERARLAGAAGHHLVQPVVPRHSHRVQVRLDEHLPLGCARGHVVDGEVAAQVEAQVVGWPGRAPFQVGAGGAGLKALPRQEPKPQQTGTGLLIRQGEVATTSGSTNSSAECRVRNAELPTAVW